MAFSLADDGNLLLVHHDDTIRMIRMRPNAAPLEEYPRLRTSAMKLCAGGCVWKDDVCVFLSAVAKTRVIVILLEKKLNNVLYPVHCAGSPPVTGEGASMARLGRDHIVLWGGGEVGGGASGYGVLSLCSWVWVDFTTMTRTSPPARSHASLTSLENEPGGVVLFGGLENDSTLSNRLDFLSLRMEWELDMRIGGALPPARSKHAACPVSDGLIIHGGIGINGLQLDDVFLLHVSRSFTDWHWSEATFQGVRLSRSGHVIACPGATGEIVVFGGSRDQSSSCRDSNDSFSADTSSNMPTELCIVVDRICDNVDHGTRTLAHPPPIQRLSC